MTISIYQVDAFANSPFTGNPAAVIPLDDWLPDHVMQNIASENNLSETAFFCPKANDYKIRWFTPVTEVNLCGHATLASAHVLFEHLNIKSKEIKFHSKSGELFLAKRNGVIKLNFPVSAYTEVPLPDNLKNAFNITPSACFKGDEDYMLIFKSEKEIKNLVPDYKKLMQTEMRGVICTAKAKDFDFVSRFFAPAVGIYEDPVTGSAHTLLIPYWAKKLKKTELVAKQISQRGGILYCQYLDSRVIIGGKARTYMIGEIIL